MCTVYGQNRVYSLRTAQGVQFTLHTTIHHNQDGITLLFTTCTHLTEGMRVDAVLGLMIKSVDSKLNNKKYFVK